MTFQDNPTLGRFNGPQLAATRARQEELKAAYQQIAKLEADLQDCREYLEDQMDVKDGENGPLPNRAMQLVNQINETLHGPGGF